MPVILLFLTILVVGGALLGVQAVYNMSRRLKVVEVDLKALVDGNIDQLLLG